MKLVPDDWGALFRVEMPLLEIFVRGTVVYFAIFFLLRVFRRQTGSIGIPDVIVIVVIADGAGNALSGGYKSITEGVILVSVIVLWSYALDWLGFRSAIAQRIIDPQPQLLVRDGQIIHDALRKMRFSEDELNAALRVEGVDDPAKVKEARLESSGMMSVILREGAGNFGGKQDDDKGGGRAATGA